jgi:hypothetical protein
MRSHSGVVRLGNAYNMPNHEIPHPTLPDFMYLYNVRSLSEHRLSHGLFGI